MQKLLREYLDEVNRKQKRHRKAMIAMVLAAIMLVSSVAWNLMEYGVAMTGDAKCGIEEHRHSDACYTKVLSCGKEESAGHTHTDACYQTESVLSCGQEESAGHTHTDACYQDGVLVCGQEESAGHTHTDACYTTKQTLICGQEESAGHTHTDACYTKKLTCGKEEHTHSEACYIDKNADVEEASVWNAQYAGITWKDAWGEDLVTAARKQIGYKESADNYTVTEKGDHKGYTRYGQFAGKVYTDWDAAFVNFCMHYAGLEETNVFPKETETAKWYEKFAKANAGQNAAYLTEAAGYEPQAGDIVFFERKDEETKNQMGIVSSYNKEKNEIKVIEGNYKDEVKENKYAADDKYITSYLKISELEADYKNSEVAAIEEEAAEESAEAATEEAEKPAAEELNYEDDQVTVKVTAAEEGIIPEGAKLKVVPILAEDPETAEQYQDVEAKLQEKADSEAYEIAGFLAYDISLVDADGNKLEPNGEVKVSMNYKQAAIPQEVAESETTDAEIKVLHLEENASGEVTQVVDMSAEEKATVDTLITTEGEKVQSVEIATESFSTYTITWKNGKELKIHLIDGSGNDIGTKEYEYNITQKTSVEEIANQIAAQLPDYTFDRAVREDSAAEAIQADKIITQVWYDGQKSEWKGAQKSGQKENEKELKNEKEGMLYFIYTIADPGTGDGGDSGMTTLGTPEHKKYIEKISDEDYKLSLDVTGKVGEELPIDILLIVDKSGSMQNSGRYNNVNKAINELKTQLGENTTTTQINMAVVTFSSDTDGKEPDGDGNDKYYKDDRKDDAWKEVDWISLNNFNYSLKSEDCNGGTNWQAGIRKGEEVLKERANIASRKYVLFLTDGVPTFRLYGNSNTTTQGAGDSDSGSKNYNAAVTEWSKSTNLSSANTKKYVIDASGESNIKQTCTNFANAIKATCLQGTNETELRNKFVQIAKDILKPVYKNVTIEDTLSAYVDLLADPQFEIIKTISGESTQIDASKIERKSVQITVDGEKRTSTKISILLEDGNQLEDGAKYTLSFHVKPSEYAKTTHQDSGYLHTGDPNTDVPGKPESEYTSSGKPGFYSNDSAVLRYKENDGVEQTTDYQKPVVQVREAPIVPPEEDTPEDVPHHKYIDYLGDGGANAQTTLSGQEYYRLYLDVKGIPNTEPEPADIVLVLDYSSSMNYNFAADGNRWAYVQKSARLAVNTLLPDNIPTDNRIGIVWFDRRANENNVAFTNSKADLLASINNMTPDSGTNYQAAFWNAQDMLKSSAGRKKFVVFVTDGEPYHYYTGNKNQQTEEFLYYNGNMAQAKIYASSAVRGFNSYGLNGFYAVSVGPDTGKDFLQNDIVGNVNASVKSVIEATDETQLTNAFNMVLGSITKQIGNVTLTDKLSEYVDFVDETGEALAPYDTDNDGVISGKSGDETSKKLGLKVNYYNYNAEEYDTHTGIESAQEYKGDFTYKIDLRNKKISVNLGKEYFLERDVVYTISFNVALTEAATEETMTANNTVGDLSTDYPGNATSSEKLGLYSNDSATLTYERVVNGVTSEESKEYEKPVVQPYEKIDWKIKKINQGNTQELKDAEFTLSLEDGTVVYNGTSGEGGIVTWKDVNGNILTSSKEISKGTYILEETKAPIGYIRTDEKWKVVISAKGARPVITNITNNDKEVTLVESIGNGYYTLDIVNEVVYSLPSTGGPGIYWYIFGGILLMAVAMLIIYKNKCKEVLKR